ncbi:uncharacterized protein [Parasteatoda tepidariorum]|uniref:uncharacterized protein n=1 Tax=Parasteatoda tepidariorum TaxID=114398 RepID=UPI0039BCFA9A
MNARTSMSVEFGHTMATDETTGQHNCSGCLTVTDHTAFSFVLAQRWSTATAQLETSSIKTSVVLGPGWTNVIIGRLECGRTQLEVTEELGITQSVLSRLWQRFLDDGNVSRRYSTGRPRVTTPNEDRYLAVTAKRSRRSTASDLSRQLSSATGTTFLRQTVCRRLGHIGLYARRSVRCVPLTATHCSLRLTWSREHAMWTPQQWSCVMFSDESRFSLQSDSRRTFIWREPGTRYHQDNNIERHRYGGA